MIRETEKFFVDDSGVARVSPEPNENKRELPPTPEKFFVDVHGVAADDLDKLEKVLGSEADGPSSLDESIYIQDLPVSWREHIAKRKKEGFLPADKNIFSRYELLKASSAEDSFTPSWIVDKIFARVKKEKIDFEDLPQVWQERLKDENIFGNFTVEYLKERGALDKDIATIKAAAEARRVDQIKQDIKETTTPFLSPEEAGKAFMENTIAEENPSADVPIKKSWWDRIKSRRGF
jgi:hypothetical protein